MVTKVYEGRFGEEYHLFDTEECTPDKDDFIFYNDEIYKVLYDMYDYENNDYLVFVRKAVEEDF